MKPDVNKRTEIDYILDFAGNFHAFFQVFKLEYAFLHDWCRVVFARVAVRFLQFFDDVVERSFAELVFFAKSLACFCADFVTGFYRFINFARNFIIFRVNPSVVERVFAFCNFQKACALFKSFRTKSRNFFQFLAAFDFSVYIAVGNDFFSCA